MLFNQFSRLGWVTKRAAKFLITTLCLQMLHEVIDFSEYLWITTTAGKFWSHALGKMGLCLLDVKDIIAFRAFYIYLRVVFLVRRMDLGLRYVLSMRVFLFTSWVWALIYIFQTIFDAVLATICKAKPTTLATLEGNVFTNWANKFIWYLISGRSNWNLEKFRKNRFGECIKSDLKLYRRYLHVLADHLMCFYFKNEKFF